MRLAIPMVWRHGLASLLADEHLLPGPITRSGIEAAVLSASFVAPRAMMSLMNVDSFDEYAARKRFSLSGRASDEQLARRMLELAGVQVDVSSVTPAERTMLYCLAVVLGTAAGPPWRSADAGELRAAARDAAETVESIYPSSLIRSVVAKLYPRGGCEPRAVLAAIGYKALDLTADLKSELEMSDDQPTSYNALAGRHDDHYSELADRHGIWDDD